MSEYQYYEFLAVDRPLSDRQLAEVRGISSRAELTPTSFVNEYHFGDFKGDPLKFLNRYYDLMVYYANWGTHRFMFSVPRQAIDARQAEAYCGGNIEIHAAGEKIVFDLTADDEGGDWEDEGGGNWMAELAAVRNLVIQGDLRALYLAWLSGLGGMSGDDMPEDELEPPAPAGLNELPACLESLAEFLRVDEDLLEVAAQGSARLADGLEGFNPWLAALPEAEKARLLQELAGGAQPHAAANLRRRFVKEQAAQRPADTLSKRRSVGQLLREARRAAEERQERERREAAQKRAAAAARAAKERADYLEGLSGREETLWKQVETLVGEKKAGAYEQAVRLLTDLRDLAERGGQRGAFDQRMADVFQRHQKKPAFIQRVRKAGLV